MLLGNPLRGLCALAALSTPACDDGASLEPASSELASLRTEPPSPPVARPASSCTLTPDCRSVPLVFIDLKACCTPTTACGFEVTGGLGLPDFRDTVADAVGLGPGETCAPRERYFIRHPSIDDLRIATEGGKDILLSSACDSTSILSITFGGCCMPNNRCGVSTYGIWDTIGVLAPEAPFAKLQCVAAAQMNAQIAESRFRGLHYLRDTDAPCDYAALDATLPPADAWQRTR